MLKIITEPTVKLVGKSKALPDVIEEFLGFAPCHALEDKGEDLVETAGRLCYMSFQNPRPGGKEAYLKHIKEVGHGSILEHATANFMISGVSRSLTHQFIRHRAGWSYSELSQRFVDSNEVGFVIPPAYLKLPKESDVPKLWKVQCEESLKTYVTLRDAFSIEWDKWDTDLPARSRRKANREAARSVLPECAETKIFVTVNCRALRHFLHLRGSQESDAEIRRLALAILEIVRLEFPNIFSDFSVHTQGGLTYIKSVHGSF